jgi:hypothetical protein
MPAVPTSGLPLHDRWRFATPVYGPLKANAVPPGPPPNLASLIAATRCGGAISYRSAINAATGGVGLPILQLAVDPALSPSRQVLLASPQPASPATSVGDASAAASPDSGAPLLESRVNGGTTTTPSATSALLRNLSGVSLSATASLLGTLDASAAAGASALVEGGSGEFLLNKGGAVFHPSYEGTSVTAALRASGSVRHDPPVLMVATAIAEATQYARASALGRRHLQQQQHQQQQQQQLASLSSADNSKAIAQVTGPLEKARAATEATTQAKIATASAAVAVGASAVTALAVASGGGAAGMIAAMTAPATADEETTAAAAAIAAGAAAAAADGAVVAGAVGPSHLPKAPGPRERTQIATGAALCAAAECQILPYLGTLLADDVPTSSTANGKSAGGRNGGGGGGGRKEQPSASTSHYYGEGLAVVQSHTRLQQQQQQQQPPAGKARSGGGAHQSGSSTNNTNTSSVLSGSADSRARVQATAAAAAAVAASSFGLRWLAVSSLIAPATAPLPTVHVATSAAASAGAGTGISGFALHVPFAASPPCDFELSQVSPAIANVASSAALTALSGKGGRRGNASSSASGSKVAAATAGADQQQQQAPRAKKGISGCPVMAVHRQYENARELQLQLQQQQQQQQKHSQQPQLVPAPNATVVDDSDGDGDGDIPARRDTRPGTPNAAREDTAGDAFSTEGIPEPEAASGAPGEEGLATTTLAMDGGLILPVGEHGEVASAQQAEWKYTAPSAGTLDPGVESRVRRLIERGVRCCCHGVARVGRPATSTADSDSTTQNAESCPNSHAALTGVDSGASGKPLFPEVGGVAAGSSNSDLDGSDADSIESLDDSAAFLRLLREHADLWAGGNGNANGIGRRNGRAGRGGGCPVVNHHTSEVASFGSSLSCGECVRELLEQMKADDDDDIDGAHAALASRTVLADDAAAVFNSLFGSSGANGRGRECGNAICRCTDPSCCRNGPCCCVTGALPVYPLSNVHSAVPTLPRSHHHQHYSQLDAGTTSSGYVGSCGVAPTPNAVGGQVHCGYNASGIFGVAAVGPAAMPLFPVTRALEAGLPPPNGGTAHAAPPPLLAGSDLFGANAPHLRHLRAAAAGTVSPQLAGSAGAAPHSLLSCLLMMGVAGEAHSATESTLLAAALATASASGAGVAGYGVNGAATATGARMGGYPIASSYHSLNVPISHAHLTAPDAMIAAASGASLAPAQGQNAPVVQAGSLPKLTTSQARRKRRQRRAVVLAHANFLIDSIAANTTTTASTAAAGCPDKSTTSQKKRVGGVVDAKDAQKSMLHEGCEDDSGSEFSDEDSATEEQPKAKPLRDAAAGSGRCPFKAPEVQPQVITGISAPQPATASQPGLPSSGRHQTLPPLSAVAGSSNGSSTERLPSSTSVAAVAAVAAGVKMEAGAPHQQQGQFTAPVAVITPSSSSSSSIPMRPLPCPAAPYVRVSAMDGGAALGASTSGGSTCSPARAQPPVAQLGVPICPEASQSSMSGECSSVALSTASQQPRHQHYQQQYPYSLPHGRSAGLAPVMASVASLGQHSPSSPDSSVVVHSMHNGASHNANGVLQQHLTPQQHHYQQHHNHQPLQQQQSRKDGSISSFGSRGATNGSSGVNNGATPPTPATVGSTGSSVAGIAPHTQGSQGRSSGSSSYAGTYHAPPPPPQQPQHHYHQSSPYTLGHQRAQGIDVTYAQHQMGGVHPSVPAVGAFGSQVGHGGLAHHGTAPYLQQSQLPHHPLTATGPRGGGGFQGASTAHVSAHNQLQPQQLFSGVPHMHPAAAFANPPIPYSAAASTPPLTTRGGPPIAPGGVHGVRTLSRGRGYGLGAAATGGVVAADFGMPPHVLQQQQQHQQQQPMMSSLVSAFTSAPVGTADAVASRPLPSFVSSALRAQHQQPPQHHPHQQHNPYRG